MVFSHEPHQLRKKDITLHSPKLRQVLAQATNMDSNYDPNGSYTGRPLAANEKPVQDADDL